MSVESKSKEIAERQLPSGLEESDLPRPRQPWKPGPIISEPDPVNKALPAGIVRAVARSENGRAFLDLQNDTDARIEVRNLRLYGPSGHRTRIGPEATYTVALDKGEVRRLDVTDMLKEWIAHSSLNPSGTFHFRIQMHFDPEPRLQPSLVGAYKAVQKDGNIEVFRADGGE